MKIAVVGASGRSGRAFVLAALAAGHSVTAGTLHAEVAISATHQLTTKLCDATDPAEVGDLIVGQDAVVSLVGHVRGSAPDVQARAMKVITAAMHEAGVRRLVSLTGTGVRFPDDKVTFVDRVLNQAVRIIDPARIKDGIKHAEVIKQSDTDWTIIRVLKLQTTPPKPYALLEHGPGKLIVSRYEVAQAILEVLADDQYIHKAPIIGLPKH